MTAEWTEDALDRLADIYVAAAPSERDAVVRCVGLINSRLAADPWDVGESRGPRRRVWFVYPLVVAFDLLPSGTVLVNHVAKLKTGTQRG
jgi:hypothetical protein